MHSHTIASLTLRRIRKWQGGRAFITHTEAAWARKSACTRLHLRWIMSQRCNEREVVWPLQLRTSAMPEMRPLWNVQRWHKLGFASWKWCQVVREWVKIQATALPIDDLVRVVVTAKTNRTRAQPARQSGKETGVCLTIHCQIQQTKQWSTVLVRRAVISVCYCCSYQTTLPTKLVAM